MDTIIHFKKFDDSVIIFPGFTESIEATPYQSFDQVKIELDAELLKDLQEGHGGWTTSMSKVLFHIIIIWIYCYTDHNIHIDILLNKYNSFTNYKLFIQ